ncbi:MAG: hypothetical protein QOD75_1116 [Blastocatellia bacterium]|nr:hypothetical protein [Blastocatellia bacterium]
MTLVMRSSMVLVCLFSLVTLTIAQANKPAADTASKSLSSNKAAVNAAAERAAKERRATAVSLLVTLADDVKNFTDQTLRARTQARIGDALWDADPDQGRTLFRKAWDAAELADQEAARRSEEDRQRQQAEGRGFALVRPPNLRLEVLRLAAKRDRLLGEELLDKLKEAKKQEADSTPAPPGVGDTSAATRQRLQLANQLLDTDMERALQFADPVLGTVTMDGLNFLSFLRDKNPAAADQRYSRMLMNAEADLQSDANTVSLLSSYLFTPHLFVVFEREGGQNTSQMNQRMPPPEVAPELRAAYMRIAAAILLRPLPPPEQDRSSSGIQGKFLVIRRLLPLFEQYAPKATADQLRGEMASLGQGTQRSARDEDDDDGLPQRGLAPEQNPADREKALLDRIDRARTPAERNAIYLQLATINANKGDLRARDFVEKIDDSEMRDKVRPYIDMTLALNVVEKKDTEKTLNIARTGELSHIQRVWVLTQAVKTMPKTDREKALEIVAEAAAEARRIEPSDADRPRALIAVANALMSLDAPRGWEALPEIAKAANSAQDFTGEDGRLMIRLQTPSMTSIRTSTVDDFNLTGLFRTLTQENYTEAVQLARNFEREAPRATAVISIARTILSEKQK